MRAGTNPYRQSSTSVNKNTNGVGSAVQPVGQLLGDAANNNYQDLEEEKDMMDNMNEEEMAEDQEAVEMLQNQKYSAKQPNKQLMGSSP